MPAVRRLTFIHTVASLEPTFAALASTRLAGWQCASIVDETLLGRVIEQGHVGPDVVESLRRHIAAAQANSDAIVVTCSTLGDVVDDLAAATDTPLFRIDRGMAEKAVRQAGQIGILATLPTTLGPTTNLLRATAEKTGRPCRFEPHLCAGAFESLRAGNREKHDRLVREGFESLSTTVELVVLAQASMARALEHPYRPTLPYLTSPELGIDQIAAALRHLEPANG